MSKNRVLREISQPRLGDWAHVKVFVCELAQNGLILYETRFGLTSKSNLSSTFGDSTEKGPCVTEEVTVTRKTCNIVRRI